MRIYSILFILLSLASCSNKRLDMLCQTWQVSDVQFINEKEAIMQTDTMKGNQIEVAKFQLRDILMKLIYEFKPDGSYLTGNPSASTEGNYELKKHAITFISKQGEEVKEKSFEIEKLTKDSLILLMQNDQTSLKVKLILTPVAP
ncbi:MAG: hypothetical protein WC760_07235 [Bacteroidia bacterium]|jgi:hypothetical protein